MATTSETPKKPAEGQKRLSLEGRMIIASNLTVAAWLRNLSYAVKGSESSMPIGKDESTIILETFKKFLKVLDK